MEPSKQSDLRPRDDRPLREEEEERQAIDTCLAGRIGGLGTLYELYSQKVFRTCLRILGDRSEAEDQTQEVFVRIFSQIGRFRGRSKFSTWLYRLTVNQSLNRLRSRRRDADRFGPLSALGDPAASEGPAEQSLIIREMSDRAQDLLSGLSPDYRAVVVLREIEDLSYREISDVLEVPIGTVMSRLHRARQRLKALWQSAEQRRNSEGSQSVQNE